MTTLAHSYSSLKLFENCPHQYYRQRIKKDCKDFGGDASNYGDRIHKHLEMRLKQDLTLPQEAAAYEDLCQAVEALAQGGELLCEKEIALNDALVPVDWFDKSAWLRSKQDVLILKGSRAIVMDWKTGKRNPDSFQLALSAIAIFNLFPQIKKVKGAFVWLKDKTQDDETYVRDEMPDLMRTLYSKVGPIEEAYEFGDWRKRKSGLCGFCPVRDCEHNTKK